MKLAVVRKLALSLPEVTEEPHHRLGSFRVRGKIFVTFPTDEEHLHVFVSEADRETVLTTHPQFVEPLLWGKKVVGVRVWLANAVPSVVKDLVARAWQNKAPKALAKAWLEGVD